MWQKSTVIEQNYGDLQFDQPTDGQWLGAIGIIKKDKHQAWDPETICAKRPKC